MRNARKIGTWTAGAAVALLGTVAAAQQQTPPGVDVDTVASRLDLSDEQRGQIAPELEELNDVLARLDETRREHAELRAVMREVRGGIVETLTPEQRRQFALLLGEAYGCGYGNGMAGRMMAGPAHMPGDARMGGGAHMGRGGASGRGGPMSGGARTAPRPMGAVPGGMGWMTGTCAALPGGGGGPGTR